MNSSPEHNWEKYYLLKPNDIYVEVGAYIGRYGLIASNKNCKIILIEPSPINFSKIEQLISENRLKNTILIKKAISNEKGIRKFILNDSASRLTNSLTNSSINVEIDTLDNILTELNIQTVNLLASDCEGEEINLIKGAEKYLSEKRIKNIAIAAYHDENNPNILISFLKSKGYKSLKYEDGIVYSHI